MARAHPPTTHSNKILLFVRHAMNSEETAGVPNRRVYAEPEKDLKELAF